MRDRNAHPCTNVAHPSAEAITAKPRAEVNDAIGRALEEEEEDEEAATGAVFVAGRHDEQEKQYSAAAGWLGTTRGICVGVGIAATTALASGDRPVVSLERAPLGNSAVALVAVGDERDMVAVAGGPAASAAALLLLLLLVETGVARSSGKTSGGGCVHGGECTKKEMTEGERVA